MAKPYRIENEEYAEGIHHLMTAVDWVLGGGYDPGSGIPYENDVFVSNNFWDSKYEACTCDVDELEWGWDEANPHHDHCYQSELRRQGFKEWWSIDDQAEADRQREENDRIADNLARQHGITVGTHSHCICGRTEEWIQFQQDRKHHSGCGMDDPLFLHKPSGLIVSWYKRIGRSTESNMDMKPLDWYRILIECFESVKDDYEKKRSE